MHNFINLILIMSTAPSLTRFNTSCFTAGRFVQPPHLAVEIDFPAAKGSFPPCFLFFILRGFLALFPTFVLLLSSQRFGELADLRGLGIVFLQINDLNNLGTVGCLKIMMNTWLPSCCRLESGSSVAIRVMELTILFNGRMKQLKR